MSSVPSGRMGKRTRDTRGSFRSPSDRNKKARKNSDGDLHYTKSGQLDMRYKSSREHIAKQNASFIGVVRPSSSPTLEAIPPRANSLPNRRLSQVHRSIGVQQLEEQMPNTGLTLDETPPVLMKNVSLNSSTIEITTDLCGSVTELSGLAAAAYSTPKGTRELQSGRILQSVQVEIPAEIPKTKSKLPDMRTKLGRQWVEKQANFHKSVLPSWLPRLKDGSLDTGKDATRVYLNAKAKQEDTVIQVHDVNQRLGYYHKKLADVNSGFGELIQKAKDVPVTMPPFILLQNPEILRSFSGELGNFDESKSVASEADSFSSARSSISIESNVVKDTDYKIPSYVPQIDWPTLKASIQTTKSETIGRGAFGVVYKARWNGQEVAVKKLHLNPLTQDDQRTFMLELKILASFGDHPNLVKLYGYSSDPPAFVMEYVRLGSLSHLLYFCKEMQVEARLCDGRVKKRIAAGIVNGMRQLHSFGIIHGDLKPCNILITDDYNAKITDFGLSKLRGKTSSLVASRVMQDEDNAIAGTSAYLAPELLKPGYKQELWSDVYSFGILLNELVHEEEPYTEYYHRIRAMGPFGVVALAKEGIRPHMNSNVVPENLQHLIRRCWSEFSCLRPTFDQLVEDFSGEELIFPSFI